jgi:putative DNA primase/helicase
MLTLLVASNTTPQIHDTSVGMRRRLQVVPLNYEVPAELRDRGLAQRIVANELPGVLNLLLEGLARLRQRGDFAPPPECIEARDALLAEANTLVAFLEDACERVDGARITVRTFHQAYLDYLRQQGAPRDLSEREVAGRLRGLGFTVRKSSAMVIEGLALRRSAGSRE